MTFTPLTSTVQLYSQFLPRAPEPLASEREEPLAAAVKKEFDPDGFEPEILGPSWQRGSDGKFLLPKFTLGGECLLWAYENLRSPSGGPWVYTPEQARLVLWWYAIDESGEFLYRTGEIVRLKGWGKEPWGASVSAFELCGNCRFSGWGPDGAPLTKRPKEVWVQVVGTSRAQTKAAMKLFPGLFNDRAKKRYSLKISAEQVLANGGEDRLEAITSNPRTAEGARPSFVLATEVHHWLSANDGIELYNTIERNARKDGRLMAITNNFQPGLGSVGELNRLAHEESLQGRGEPDYVMYDSLEAPPEAPISPEATPKVLKKIIGDAYWVNVDNLAKLILSPRSDKSKMRRFYYNQAVAVADALITPAEWNGCKAEFRPLQPGDTITLGLDGGLSDDATALVAIRIADRSIHLLGLWERPRDLDQDEPWQVDMSEVDGVVMWVKKQFTVAAFFSDVHPIQSYVDKWSEEFRDVVAVKASPGRSVVGFDMRGNGPEITRTNEHLVGAVRAGAVLHNGDATLRRHVLNTYQAPNRWGMSFRKKSRESAYKVDAYAATLLAYVALNRFIESGKSASSKRGGEAWVFAQ